MKNSSPDPAVHVEVPSDSSLADTGAGSDYLFPTGARPQTQVPMDIRLDDLSGPAISRLVQDHLRSMALHSPPESVHALNLDALREPAITFWSVWQHGGSVCGLR